MIILVEFVDKISCEIKDWLLFIIEKDEFLDLYLIGRVF